MKIKKLLTLLPVIFFVGSSLASTRVNAEGAVDASWGTSGVLCTNSGTGSGFTRDAVKLSDGSIISVGYGFITSSFHIIVTKTLPNGTPDSTFGTNGTVELESLSSLFTFTYANNVAVQSDGKIVVAGAGTSASQQDVLVIRLTASGSLDPTFSGDGIVSVAPSSSDDNAHGVVVLPDGDIVIAGGTYQGATSMGDLFMARINTDGTFDAAFDGDGTLIRDLFGYSNDDFYDLIRRDDGTLLVGGTSGGNPVVVAVSPTGSLVTSFNDDGIARVTTLGGYLKSITLDSDGKIVFGGTGPALSSTISTTMVGRLTSQGNLDTTFNGTGYNIFVTSDSAVIEDVVVQSDGKIGSVGRSPQVSDPSRWDVVAARFTSSGILDSSFTGTSTTGYTVFGNPSRDDDGYALVIGTDGSFLVAATYWPTSAWCMSIVKLSTSFAPTSWSDQTVETATRGTAYAGTVASNLGASATYAVTSGTLPSGVTLGSNGTFTGTPTQSGQFPITITATTGSGTLDLTTTLTVNGSPLWSDLSSDVTVASATVGVPYSDGVSAVAYPAPTYSLASSTPPPGLTLNSNGTITGTPTLAGSFTFSVQANNGVGSPTTRSLTITVNQLDTFTTVTPARVADTRDNTGGVGTTKIGNGAGGGTPLQFEVLGTGNVPSSGVAAVSLNVTAVSAQVGDEGGFVTVYPCLSGQPNVSNLNFTNGQTIPNAVIVPVDSNGNICVYVYGRAHIIIDVNGWFRSGAGFTTVTPARVADTRDNTGGVGTTKIGNGAGGGTPLQFEVLGTGNVPSSGVAAVSLNVTAVSAQVGDEGGFVTVYPCLSGQPNVSNLNFTNGQTIPNAVIVPVDSNGNICVYVYGRAHIIIDVNGWFGTSSTFTPLSPQRIGDTRDNTGGVGTTKIGNGAGGGTALTFNVGLRGGVPASGVAAVSLNVTAVSAQVGDEGGFVTVYPCLSGQPNVSNLNFTNGQTIPNAVIVPVDSNGNICVYVYGRAHIIIDVNGWFG